MMIDKLDSFISKARLGDILSYVPDITKPGQRTNLKKSLRYNPCKDWKEELLLFMVLAKQKKDVSDLPLSRRL